MQIKPIKNCCNSNACYLCLFNYMFFSAVMTTHCCPLPYFNYFTLYVEYEDIFISFLCLVIAPPLLVGQVEASKGSRKLRDLLVYFGD